MSIPEKSRNAVMVRSNEGLCEVCGAQGTNTHHRRPRGLGGSKDPATNLPSNLVRLCGSGITGCHGWIESNRAHAYHLGLLVHLGHDPAAVPVMLRAHGWVLLNNDGSVTPVNNPHEEVA